MMRAYLSIRKRLTLYSASKLNGEIMRIHKKFLSSVAAVTILASVQPVLAYETTIFSVDLSDSSKTGSFSIENSNLGDGTTVIDTSGTTYTYNYVYQYFTPTVSGTYVFG